MGQLEKDPVHIARVQEMERQRKMAIEENLRELAPLYKELADAGYKVNSLSELVTLFPCKEVIPILLKWLPTLQRRDTKESVVRALSVPWAKPIAAKPLIAEFLKAPESEMLGLKWAIGNALEVLADDSFFEDIRELVLDRRHGRSREMLVLALGKMKNPKAADLLIDLLGDDEVAVNAIMALRKLNAKKALPFIERFANHPKAWIRQEAKKAIIKLQK